MGAKIIYRISTEKVSSDYDILFVWVLTFILT
jgi:hypothetical protein